MNRRSLIVLLAGLNLLLLVVIVFSVTGPQQAFGQAAGRATDYVIVTGETETDNDVIYLVDSRARRMYAFRTTYPRMPGTPARFGLLAQRDLAGDFGRPR